MKTAFIEENKAKEYIEQTVLNKDKEQYGDFWIEKIEVEG